MHMADALVSPGVGGVMWAASAGLIAYCARTLNRVMDDSRVPLMGVLGAFVFAVQMINFTVPGTGSSGHLGGGLVLAVLLGPHAAFLVLASVLVVQALFFADGGILAMGCNMFNLGFFPCFIVYPLIFKKIYGNKTGRTRLWVGSIAASVTGLVLGALAVVFQTVFSGVAELPFRTFTLFMVPVHIAIGIVEGMVTAGVLTAVWHARPELGRGSADSENKQPVYKELLAGFMAVAILTGGILSWYASENPDGLEWSIFKTSGKEETAGISAPLHDKLADMQETTALLPDYGFEHNEGGGRAGTTLSGLLGSVITLILVLLAGLIIRRRRTVI